MTMIWTYIIPFGIALGVLILFHELGHYWVARACGVKVLRFSIGFGRPLLKYRASADGTEWVLAVFPLGGYVKMLDEEEGEVSEAERHRAFNIQPLWRRFAIVAAGPIANLLLALVLYWGLFVAGSTELRPLVMTTGQDTLAAQAQIEAGDLVLSVNSDNVKSWQDLRWALLRHALDRGETRLRVRTHDEREAVRVFDFSAFTLDEAGSDPIARMGLRPWDPPSPARIAQVDEGAAARAGLRVDDEIVAIDDKAVSSWQEVVDIVRASAGRERRFTVSRGGENLDLAVLPDEKTTGKEDERIGVIGVGFARGNMDKMITEVRYGPVEAVGRALRQTWEVSALSLQTIFQMLTGTVSPRNISGPITIADYAGQSAQMGLKHYLHFLALISISLGILNLLPVPVLDGGLLLYYAVEFIKGRPLPVRVMEIGQQIGLTLLFMLMAFAIYNDVNRIISG
ncbi:MAG: RIP metalloprotease RseP [Azoarcus sp.]|jgi:regulator of sigma E protease|nr:RIP metalloprotease RseP [Azoarcus sp.]